MKRIVTPELLDSDAGTPKEIADSLADLRGINRKFGGIGTTQAMIEHVWKGLRLLREACPVQRANPRLHTTSCPYWKLGLVPAMFL